MSRQDLADLLVPGSRKRVRWVVEYSRSYFCERQKAWIEMHDTALVGDGEGGIAFFSSRLEAQALLDSMKKVRDGWVIKVYVPLNVLYPPQDDYEYY